HYFPTRRSSDLAQVVRPGIFPNSAKMLCDRKALLLSTTAVNRNITVSQWSERIEERTCRGNPDDREVVRPDHRRIAQNNCGVVDGSTVEQGAPAIDKSLVP